MNKKIIFIILGALALLALMFFLWFWFFGRGPASNPSNTGSLGTGDNTSASTNGSGDNGNGQAPIGSNTDTSANNGSGSTVGSDYVPTYSYATSSSSITYSNPAGVTWFGGSNGSGGVNGNNSFGFTQTPINSVGGGSINGTPHITTVTGADGQNISLFSSLAVVIGGCLVEYGAQELLVRPAVTAADAGIGSAVNILGNIFGFIFPGANAKGDTPLNPMYTSDNAVQGLTGTNGVSQCLTRSLGRLAVQQITNSTVDWINSGFDGQPAYVQDFGQFFNQVADESAGAFIQGTGLAFLCSPFQLQVKIAIAQSYANRHSSGSSCTLSGVTGNIDNFVKGNFSDGGWPAFLQFTTVPANNPYAGYMAGQSLLNNAISWDEKNKALTISPGGFLAQTETYDCKTTKDPDGGPPTKNCSTRIVTPGSAIEDSLHVTFQGQLDSLQLGDSIDQILGALTNQLITKTLYNGLANAGQSSASPTNTANTQAQTLMNTIQGGVTNAQQYASVKQRSISDIQAAESNLAGLGNCWAQATSSAGATASMIAQGNEGFSSVVLTLTTLEAQVAAFNNSITAANTSIAALQSLQTDLLLATVPSDVSSAQTRFTALQNSGNPHIYTAADFTTAQQDRQTLQSQLSGLNQTTSAQLTQCYALGH